MPNKTGDKDVAFVAFNEPQPKTTDAAKLKRQIFEPMLEHRYTGKFQVSREQNHRYARHIRKCAPQRF